MGKYELIYFDVSGRAAVARMLFALAGVDFEDTRFTKEKWAAEKENSSKYPFHQLPVLRVDDTYIAESNAIISYLATEFDFHGNTNLERAHVSMICSNLMSLGMSLVQLIYEQDKEAKAKKQAAFFEEKLPQNLTCQEEILKQRENGDKYWLGEKMTVADVAFLDMALIIVQLGGPTVYDSYPKLKSLKERLEANSKLVDLLSKRKQSF